MTKKRKSSNNKNQSDSAFTSKMGHKELSTMRVVQRGNRLSITEVSKNEWDYILNLEKK